MTGSIADREEHWPVSSSRDLHRDEWVLALREDVVHRPGRRDEPGFPRLVIEHPGAAIVLAVDDRERVCLLRQYRHAPGRSFVELPAGICDVPGEDPVATARRELREEVELEADHWRHLLSCYPSAGTSSEMHHLYLATGLHAAPRGDFEMVHEEAEMEKFWAPLSELADAVLSGRVQQEPVALAVLAHQALQRRQER